MSAKIKSSLIVEMMDFCDKNGIEYITELVDYAKKNRGDWCQLLSYTDNYNKMLNYLHAPSAR